MRYFILSLGTKTVDSFPEHYITTLLHERFPSWVISFDSMVASEYGDNIFATRIVFRGSCSLYRLHDLLPLRDSDIRSPNLAYLDDYNSAQFSTFTTRPIHSFPSVSTASTPSTSPFIFCFVLPTVISKIGSDFAIVDITHPPPEPSLQPSTTLFDGWLGVLFLDTDHITHVRSPRPSEIFRIYALPPPVVQSLSLLHPSISCSICLYIFPFCTASVLASFIILDTISPSYCSVYSPLVSISHCFTFRPAPTKSTWTVACTTDSDTNRIINALVSGFHWQRNQFLFWM